MIQNPETMKAINNFRYIIILIILLSTQKLFSQYSNYIDPATRNLYLEMEYSKIGSLPGSVDVGRFGESNYVIPLFIAPGTANMQPSVSIVYSSSIDDGVMGKGFTIGGLSEIRRIPRDFYHDDEVKGVSIQSTDFFALDSMRLILTSQGQYGGDGTEYATEIESFVRVTAHGTTGAGPTWFEAETKEGKILQYGNSSDSRVILPNSSSVYMWRLNRIEDANGNYITYSYEQTNGES
jgi:hypothetical protein